MPDPVAIAPAPPAPGGSPPPVADGGGVKPPQEKPQAAPVVPDIAQVVVDHLPAKVAAPATRAAFTVFQLCMRLL